MTTTLPLVAEGLRKVIGQRTIVDDVSFSVHPGEVFGFLGPNGAGKTTTIRMLVGLIRPTSGRALICGHDVRREFSAAMRCIGCIVETPDLYGFLSGRENLEHFARMIGDVKPADLERVASLVSLDRRLEDRVDTYSLGMRQRLGIAQALLGHPRVLILDEPANGLDPAGIREIRGLLRSLSRNEGISIFVSSHLLAEIELMCDRVAIIHRGRILKTGRIDEIVSEKRRMEIRVDRPEDALAIAERMGFPATLEESVIILGIDDHQVPPLVDALIGVGILVFRIEPRMQTLEDAFLETTGGETVGD